MLGRLYYYGYSSVSQTIFDDGKPRNNLRYYKAADQEYIDTYQQTIAGAVGTCPGDAI